MTSLSKGQGQAPPRLQITLHKARDLASFDRDTGLSDPYAVVRLGRRYHRSRIIKSSLNPSWEDTFRMGIDDANELTIELWDYDVGTADDYMGSLTIKLNDLKLDEAVSTWYPLDEGQGEIMITLKITGELPDKLRGEASAAGQHFMASRPWAGAIFPPTSFDESRLEREPPGNLKLVHAFGYRSRNCRSNIHLVANSKRIVYHTAALGVCQDMTTLVQSHFTDHGSAEILSLTVDPTGKYMASGDQITVHAIKQQDVYIKVWSHENPQETLATLSCGRKMAGVAALSFSAPGKDGESQYLVAIGTDVTHTLVFFDWRQSGEPLVKMAAHSSKVLDVACHPTDPHQFVTVGNKHVKFWTFNPKTKKLESRKGVFGSPSDMQTMLSVAFVNDREVATVSANGAVYLWDLEKRTVVDIAKGVHSGSVFAMAAQQNSVLTGGKDGHLLKFTVENSRFSSPTEVFHDPDNGVIRAIAWRGDQVAIGYQDSSIVLLYDINQSPQEPRRLLEAHSTFGNSEVWGLAAHPTRPECATVSEDMRVIRWDLEKHRPVISLQLDRPLRSCVYDPTGKWLVAVATTDHAFILETEELVPVHEIEEKGGRQTAVDHPVKFSPDGQYLAIGGFRDDHGIAIYKTGTWELVGVCSGHSSHVINMDWSSDSQNLQSNSMELELLFWSIPSCEQITKASTLCDQDWATFTLTMAWPTTGIWEPGMSGRDINAVARNKARNLLVSGNDFSQVGLHSFPNPSDNMPSKKFNGHSSHVTNVVFTPNDRWVMTIGGLDGTVLQWEVEHL